MNRGDPRSSPLYGVGHCTRRRFLLSAVAGLMVAGPGTRRKLAAADLPGPCPEPAWLAKLITHRESATRLGRAYLVDHPGYRHCDELVADIDRALKKHAASGTVSAYMAHTAATVQRSIASEFVHAEVVSVDGWILSITEARLYALIALNVKP